MIKTIRIATRSSELALWQANWVRDSVMNRFPQMEVDLVHIKTKGDKILDSPLAKIGGKGLFVKELEIALLEKKADLAVHSLKDVPVELPDGLEISVITKRETPEDAFVSNTYPTLKSLPPNAVVGTSSLRRVAQLQTRRTDLRFKSLRGNVNTRLRKLDNGEFDAIVLAAAGLIRLGEEDRITELISSEDSLPAIGQGVVCVESRVNDTAVLDSIRHLRDEETTVAVTAERALLKRLNGGCQVPLAGFARLRGETLSLTGMLARPDGSDLLRMEIHGSTEEARQLGTQLGERLLNAGGRAILAEIGIEVE